VATATTIFVYAFFNLVAALVSYPSGVVIDKLGRKITFLAALTIFAGVFLGFAVSSNVLAIAGLFALYGAYQGIFRAVGKTLAIDLATPQLKASGVGIFSSVFGLGSFAASLIGGQLWVAVSPAATFYYGFALALAGLFTAFFFIPATNHKQTT
jgi:MFS family permease